MVIQKPKGKGTFMLVGPNLHFDICPFGASVVFRPLSFLLFGSWPQKVHLVFPGPRLARCYPSPNLPLSRCFWDLRGNLHSRVAATFRSSRRAWVFQLVPSFHARGPAPTAAIPTWGRATTAGSAVTFGRRCEGWGKRPLACRLAWVSILVGWHVRLSYLASNTWLRFSEPSFRGSWSKVWHTVLNKKLHQFLGSSYSMNA